MMTVRTSDWRRAHRPAGRHGTTPTRTAKSFLCRDWAVFTIVMISQPGLSCPTLAPANSKSQGVKSASAKSNVEYSGALVDKLVITRRLLPGKKCRFRSFRSCLNASSQVRFEHGWPFGEVQPITWFFHVQYQPAVQQPNRIENREVLVIKLANVERHAIGVDLVLRTIEANFGRNELLIPVYVAQV